VTAVERMSARKRGNERLRLGDERRRGAGVPKEGRGSDGMLVSLCPRNIATVAVKGGDGDENS